MPQVRIEGLFNQPQNLMLPAGNMNGVPGTVEQAEFLSTQIYQNSPYPAAENTITVKFKLNVPIPGPSTTGARAMCGSIITISGLDGACANPGKLAITTGMTGLSYQAGVTSTDKSGTWDKDLYTLQLFTANNGLDTYGQNNEYSFTFTVNNPANGQSSPKVSIEMSGITIAKTAMTKGTGAPPANIFNATALESEPLEIRGQLEQNEFRVKKVGQSSSKPGDTANTITVTFASTVPLTKASPTTIITISGFMGAKATLSGSDFTAHAEGSTPGTFDVDVKSKFIFQWDNTKKRVLLTPQTSDTDASKSYKVTFVVTNPEAGQQSPEILIESSGIVVQPSAMDPAVTALATTDDTNTAVAGVAGSAAPLFVEAPRLILRKVDQNFCNAVKTGSAYPGDANCINIAFTPTVKVAAAAQNGTSTVIDITGLNGVVLPDGPVALEAVGDHAKFSDCRRNFAGVTYDCAASKGMWISSKNTLSLQVITDLAANTEVSLRFKFTNPLMGQEPPVISVGMTSTSNTSTFDISPQVLSLPTNLATFEDRTALLIKHSATFTTKTIKAETTNPGSTNKITVAFRPEFDLTGDKLASITIAGLIGSDTPDSTISLTGTLADIKKFNSRAAWKHGTGTLVVTVAPGETVANGADTTFSFDLVNPKYTQTGPSLDTIVISATGDVPIAATCMVKAAGGEMPLMVTAAKFTVATITSASQAAGANNQVSIAFRPDTLLSAARDSYVQVVGLTGSLTSDTEVLPLHGFTAGSTTADFSLSAPMGDVTMGFHSECKLSDDQISVNIDGMGISSLKDVPIIFSEGPAACKNKWLMVTDDYDGHGCVNTSTTMGDWRTACKAAIGAVDSIEVIDGGFGYTSGAFTVREGAGTGLEGTCIADAMGTVTSINISSAGSGYGVDTEIVCPSKCAANICQGTESTGAGGAFAVMTAPLKASLIAGRFHSPSGSLRLKVRNILSTSANTDIKVNLKNSLTAKDGVTANIFAGGATPISSTNLVGANTTMRVASLRQAVTHVCDGTTNCEVTNAFAGVPAGLSAYVLKAERQCNGEPTTLKISVAKDGAAYSEVTAANSIMNMSPVPCMNDCSSYKTVFEYLDLKGLVQYDGGQMKVKADITGTPTGIETDFCGEGKNIKIIFTMEYDEKDYA